VSGSLRAFTAKAPAPTSEELVAEAVERVKAHIDVDALEARVISAAVKQAVDQALEQKHEHRAVGRWQGVTAGVGLGLLVAWIFMSGFAQTLTRASVEAVGFGTVLGGAEKDQKALREIAP